MAASAEEMVLKRSWSDALNHPDVTSGWADAKIFNPNRQDSVWYDHVVVSLFYLNRFELTIKAVGDVDMRWTKTKKEDDCCESDSCLEDRISWLEEHDIYSDDQLSYAYSEGDIDFDNNNWFEIYVWDSIDKKYIDMSDNVWEASPVDIDSEEIMGWIREYLSELSEEESWNAIRGDFEIELNRRHRLI